jgi:hypothetical protein
MRWSKVKKLVEESFADSIKRRVKVFSTRYECSCGRGWITVDGKEIADLSTMLSGLIYRCVYHESSNTPYLKHQAVAVEDRADGKLVERGEFSRFDLHLACWDYLHQSLNDSLASENPLIKSLAVLNAKVGKGRLLKLKKEELHPLTRSLLDFRISAEGFGDALHKNESSRKNEQLGR